VYKCMYVCIYKCMYVCVYVIVDNLMGQNWTTEVKVGPPCRNTNTRQTSLKIVTLESRQTSLKIVTLERDQVTARVKPSMKP